jgi:hypothetical protein
VTARRASGTSGADPLGPWPHAESSTPSKR